MDVCLNWNTLKGDSFQPWIMQWEYIKDKYILSLRNVLFIKCHLIDTQTLLQSCMFTYILEHVIQEKKVCKWKEHNEFTVFTIPPLYASYSIIDDKFYIIDLVRENISWFRSTPVMYQVCLVDNAYDRYKTTKGKHFMFIIHV